jgi:hypothetical protein
MFILPTSCLNVPVEKKICFIPRPSMSLDTQLKKSPVSSKTVLLKKNQLNFVSGAWELHTILVLAVAESTIYKEIF